MLILELLVVLGISGIFSVGLLAYYQPKINKMKKGYEEFNNTVRDTIKEMSEEEQRNYFENMPKETENFFKGILNNEDYFEGPHQFQLIQHHIEEVKQMQQDHFHDFNKWAMEESLKAVTPFDHGGYVQGAGFNPSDTLAQQMNNDLHNMSHNMDMNHNMDTNHNMDMNHHNNGF